jgi:hypothetical protein
MFGSLYEYYVGFSPFSVLGVGSSVIFRWLVVIIQTDFIIPFILDYKQHYEENS